MLGIYERGLTWVLRYPAFTLAVFSITIAVNIYLLIIVPKGFFPQQDNGTIFGRHSGGARRFLSGDGRRRHSVW